MIETTWRDFYRAAILEVDRSLVKVRLNAAEDSINARASDARASRQERREMADALWTLQRLKTDDRRLVPNGIESARELPGARAFSASTSGMPSIFLASLHRTDRELTELPCFITAMQRCPDGGYERSDSLNMREGVLFA